MGERLESTINDVLSILVNLESREIFLYYSKSYLKIIMKNELKEAVLNIVIKTRYEYVF